LVGKVDGASKGSVWSINGITWSGTAPFVIAFDSHAEGQVDAIGYGIVLGDINTSVLLTASPGAGKFAVNEYVIEGSGPRRRVGTTLVSGTSPVIARQSGVNNFRVEVRASELKFYINGSQLGSVSHPRLASRPIRLSMAAAATDSEIPVGADARFYFDNLSIIELQ
jgi:hypothetical protein